MEQKKKVTKLVNDNVIRHGVTRHLASHFPHWVLQSSIRQCKEDKRSVARRGNLWKECEKLFREHAPALLTLSFRNNISHSNHIGNPQSLINSNHFTHFKKAAFTLAEVLITLGVIGIVAAMTIPNLVQSYQEKVTVTKLKEFYSMLSQVVQMAVVENGTPDNWGFETGNSEKMITMLKPYIKFDKICDVGEKCHSASSIYSKSGGTLLNYIFNTYTLERYAAKLSNGIVMSAYLQSPDCNQTISETHKTCGEYAVDVNGSSKPNTYGSDIFLLDLTKDGQIIPKGAKEYTHDDYTFDKGCLPSKTPGWGCAAWVIQNGNMDYLKCDDLSWDGKHKCSD